MTFNRFSDYVFDDPSRAFSYKPDIIFEGKLDDKGYASFNKEIWQGRDAPGALSARFVTRVFEESGNFSISRKTIPYYPFESFVGIRTPKGDAKRGMLLTDTRHKVSIVTVNAKGEPVDLDEVKVTLYKVRWKWWWDKSGSSLAHYSSGVYNRVIQEGTISTSGGGKGEWEFNVEYPEWGRYLLRACDVNGEHCTGKIVYIDWPGWAGRARAESGVGASALTLSSDKKAYNVGEKAVIRLPEVSRGRALISIENGSGILEQRWLELNKGTRNLEVDLTGEMTPNVYVSVTVLQPHAEKKNDRPIRLYGVLPLLVEDSKTRLKLQLKATDEWAPESKVSFEVSEKEGRPMTYTVAVVDEGLLGLTSYKTPNLHKKFYRKEALGVSTWDLFDFVAGAYGGELERLLAVGGDEEIIRDGEDVSGKKRFAPVVKFFGPFQLNADEKRNHEFELPQYIGAVRVMVVAGKDAAYGKVAKSVFVREQLTLLATLPRVIGPGEEMAVPVSVFVMDDNLKNVVLKIEPDKNFKVVGSDTVKLSFDKSGDKIAMLRLKVGEVLGKGRVRLIASGGGFNASSEIFIEIRSANSQTVNHYKKVLQPGESWDEMIVPHGLAGTNAISLEVSGIPPLSLERRLQYLIRYPHGCVEQTTSSVFPQLYLPVLTNLSDKQKMRLEKNVQAGVERLRGFQLVSGGFGYWPGSSGASNWSSSYAGHFLLEAERLGYYVLPNMKSEWIVFQRSMAQSWKAGGVREDLDQAYRLYTLALAGKPEMGAMNRLRESGELSPVVRWQLAAAYQLAGQGEAASDLIKDINTSTEKYKRPGRTYGSALRDKAIILNSLVGLGDNRRAYEVVEEISAELSGRDWYSTQSVAFSLLALAGYIDGNARDVKFVFQEKIGGGGISEVTSDTPIYVRSIKGFSLSGERVFVKNTSKRVLTASVIVKGVAKAGLEKAAASGLGIDVFYMDRNGKEVKPSEITHGQDFMPRVRVNNNTKLDMENIALSHIVPSGWEIHNSRLDFLSETGSSEEGGAVTDFDYQDIRDDRIYTYFSLKAGESKELVSVFNGSYLGRFYLPGIFVEAMYDASKYGRTKGQWTTVIKSEK